jgi:DNA repair protein RadC
VDPTPSTEPGRLPATRTMAAIPVRQRPRERLLDHGPEPLADAELLAVLLGTGVRGTGALALAHELLADHGGPHGLARAVPTELARRPGVGPAKAARVVAAFGLARRLGTVRPGTTVRDSTDVAEVVRPWLADARRERVVVVVCDRGLRVRRVFVLTEGSCDECLLPVRELLTAVLLHDGSAFAVAHNHPAGDVTPSDEDRRVTAALAGAADAVGLDFLTHVIVSADRWAACESPAGRPP